ncbi:MAG: phosphoenolpyruvate--protein phosphotransferase [Gammaproteobacteria bacterium]|nr:phosphoenolpyruvate--protein phosphotransferase [Gammaproteobacteria bacterium]
MSLALSGVGVSNGVATGRAHVPQREVLEPSEYVLPQHLLAEEEARFVRAVNAARQRLKGVRNQIPVNTPVEIAAFIDTHLLMMEDDALSKAPIKFIKKHHYNAAWALKMQRDVLVAVFEQIEDPYLRTRKDDVDHVVNSILRVLLQSDDEIIDPLEQQRSDAILVVDDLAPAEIMQIRQRGFVGFITEHGSPVSHTAILARNLGIPALVSVRGAKRYIQQNDLLVVDARESVVLVDPDALLLDYYRGRRSEDERHHVALDSLKQCPAETTDQYAITLQANIEVAEDIACVNATMAAGVGLYRTEMLYLNRADAPSEEEQFENYLQIVRALNGKPLTIRTLDLGADKPWREGFNAVNPALGLRAVRLCLKEPALFMPQLRAVLRVSAFGDVRMMIPMLSGLTELQHVLHLMDEIRAEFSRDGIVFNPEMPVGAMIEVPAAALMADAFCEQLDFLSIGTNDLIQYTLATDRLDDEVNYLYDALHPAVLKLIQMTIDAGRRAAIPVAMCGEMAGDTRYTRLLLGMGLKQFSMNPRALLEVKRVVRSTSMCALTAPVERLLRATAHDEIAACVTVINEGL